jgi:RNA polymerase sigma-70 factor (ECF subfamily)
MRLRKYKQSTVPRGKIRGSDEDLMLRFREGEESAFEILYSRHEKPLFNFLYRSVMDKTEAESLCQDTFFRVVRARRNYKATAQFKTWLYQIAVNLCRDRSRRLKHRSHLSLNAQASSQRDSNAELQEIIPDPSSDFERNVELARLESLVQEAIAGLPEDENLAIILRAYQGMKLSEIAEIMDCPIGTVKSLIHRAQQKLKKSLYEYIGN